MTAMMMIKITTMTSIVMVKKMDWTKERTMKAMMERTMQMKMMEKISLMTILTVKMKDHESKAKETKESRLYPSTNRINNKEEDLRTKVQIGINNINNTKEGVNITKANTVGAKDMVKDNIEEEIRTSGEEEEDTRTEVGSISTRATEGSIEVGREDTKTEEAQDEFDLKLLFKHY